MKILITGASGRVGTKLIEALRKDHQLVLLSGDPIPSSSEKVYVSDLAKPNDLPGIFEAEQPDAVIHLAAILGQTCETNPELARAINVTAVEALAQLASQHGVKTFIFASTAAVYHQISLSPTDETSNIQPMSEYGKTKLAAEGFLKGFSQTSGTHFVVLRIFNIYGPGFANSLIDKLIRSSNDQPVELTDPDNFYRDYVYVNDVVDAFVSTLTTDLASSYTVMNIGSGKAENTSELLEALKSKGISPHYTIKPGSGQPNASWADIRQARQLINFDPQQDIVINR